MGQGEYLMALTQAQRIVARAWLRDRFSQRDYDGIINMIAATPQQQLAALRAFAAEHLPDATALKTQTDAVVAELTDTITALRDI